MYMYICVYIYICVDVHSFLCKWDRTNNKNLATSVPYIFHHFSRFTSGSGSRTSAKQQPSNPSAAGCFKTNQLCVVNSIYVVEKPWTMRLTFWKVIGRLYHS